MFETESGYLYDIYVDVKLCVLVLFVQYERIVHRKYMFLLLCQLIYECDSALDLI